MAERRDWIEDFEQENGQYSNTCVGCYRIFVGHKRRVLCKTCGGFNSTTATSNIIEEQKAEITRLREALEHYANKENWDANAGFANDVWYLTERGWTIAQKALGEREEGI